MSSDSPIDDDAVLERFIAGDCPPEQAAAIRVWLRDNPKTAERVAGLSNADTLREALHGQARPWQSDHAWTRLQAQLGAPRPAHATVATKPKLIDRQTRVGRRMTTTHVAVAAGAVLAAVLGVRWISGDLGTRVARTGPGERLQVTLADSSRITLGPASTLRYSIRKSARRVELDGLASFSVTHDPSRPFTVRAGNAEATDLGTTFVVRAYHEDSTVEVAVSSGRVELAARGDYATAVNLDAGDVGTVAANGIATRRPDANVARFETWTSGQLVFDDRPLAAVAAELGRWFDVDIRIVDPAIARRRVNAVYGSPSLEGVLDALAASLAIRYERAGRTVTISASSSPRAR